MRQLKITQNITNRESQSLEKYFQDVNKIDMITSEEEVVLEDLVVGGEQLVVDAPLDGEVLQESTVEVRGHVGPLVASVPRVTHGARGATPLRTAA